MIYGASVCMLVIQSCLTVCRPIECSLSGSFVMEFSRQEYWSEVSLPSPGDLPNPGIKPGSPALQADSLLFEPPQEGPLNGHPRSAPLQIPVLPFPSVNFGLFP